MSSIPEPTAETIDRRGDPVGRWLIEDAWRLPRIVDVLAGVCERLLATGVPLWRVNYMSRYLHPQLLGETFVWKRGVPGIEIRSTGYEFLDSDDCRESPLKPVFQERQTIRRRLVGDKAKLDFPILIDLRDEGGTDYCVLPVELSDGTVCAIWAATDGEDGFAREDFERMYALLPLFARVVELHQMRALAATLLDTYVGRDAGGRILDGQIHRGDGETIRAAIWTSDLRGFTALADELPRDDLIALLNSYFERMAAPVEARGGEVLKFIGDSLLAIFRIDERHPREEVCAAALAAAADALAGIDELNAARTFATHAPLRIGVALHLGDVMYGNIGAPNRLDFTVIGPAVNLVNRLDKLASEQGHALVASAAFADAVPHRLTSLGRHQLRGVQEPQEVFTSSGRL